MKKLLAVILSLALCCLLLPAVAEEASLAGTWHILSASAEGTEIQVVDPEAISVTVNEDGTFELTAMGTTQSGNWTVEDSVITMAVDEENVTAFTIDGDELAFDMGNGTIARLTREAVEPAAFPAAVAAESADAFDGLWLPYGQMMYGLYAPMSAEQAAAYGRLQFEGGKVTVLYDDGNGGSIETGSYDAAFADGSLTFEDNSFVATVMTVTLLEDGSLKYTSVMSTGDAPIEMSFIYVRAADAEEPAA